MSSALVLLLVPSLALLVTVVATPAVRAAAVRRGRLAEARPDRWHRRATPNLGGVAILIGFGTALLAGVLLRPSAVEALHRPRGGVLGLTPWEGLLAAGVAMFLVGLVDDVARLRPVTKLAGEVVAAAILMGAGIGFRLVGVHAVDAFLSLFWFVGITNAMNLLDNMDGLAGGIGAIAAGFMSVVLLLDGEVGLALLSLALAGALLGFLAHNYPPARIFMGDSGSLFTGLFLSGLALSGPAPGLSRGVLAVMAVPVLILSIPILDTTLVTVSRFLEGKAISRGGTDHASHGLVALGLSEERAVWVLWTLAVAAGCVALLLRTAERETAALLGGVLIIVLTLVGAFILVTRHGAGAGPTPLYRRVLAFHQRLPVLGFLLDAVLVGLAYYAAYVIRWEPGRLEAELAYFRASLPVVVAAKLLVFAWAGAYASRWRHFGLEDALRVLRANLFATILVAAALLLVQRVGLSRGVLAVDFFVCSALTVGARFSFRMMEGAVRRWSEAGTPVVLVGPAEDAALALQELGRLAFPDPLRPVAVADPAYGPPRGRFRGHPLFGGRDALAAALEATGAHAVLVVRREESDDPLPDAVSDYLRRRGGLDVWVLRVSLGRLRRPAGGWVGGPGPPEGGA